MATPRYCIPRPKRKPSQAIDTIDWVTVQAVRLSEPTIASIMETVALCARYLREGVATEDQFVAFRTYMRIAQLIERERITRGFAGHIDSVLCACSCIHDRAMRTGTWHPVPINLLELDAILDMTDLFEVQLRQLTGGELDRIVAKLIAQAQSTRGEVVHVTPTTIGASSHAHA